ncbi:hypothetical protein [Streptomyces sp. NPDC001068]|uniref:hypothetical protein n=1 Tax=Streptomyces sp. NPDC001068 TaxID=3364544 RepID=UPI0036CF1F74
MTSPAAGPEEEWEPVYEPPSWYTGLLAEGAPGSSIPWHSVGRPPGPSCYYCGSEPVIEAEVSVHAGSILWGRTRTVSDPLCRQCGISTVRSMTTRTLEQGWWGPLSLLVHAPAALLQNVRAYRRFTRLSASTPPPGRLSLPLGKPVSRRPSAYAALIPVTFAAALLVYALAATS